MSRWQDCGERGSSWHCHETLQAAPAGQRNIHQPNRYINPSPPLPSTPLPSPPLYSPPLPSTPLPSPLLPSPPLPSTPLPSPLLPSPPLYSPPLPSPLLPSPPLPASAVYDVLFLFTFVASIFAWTRGLAHRAKLDGKCGSFAILVILYLIELVMSSLQITRPSLPMLTTLRLCV